MVYVLMAIGYLAFWFVIGLAYAFYEEAQLTKRVRETDWGKDYDPYKYKKPAPLTPERIALIRD